MAEQSETNPPDRGEIDDVLARFLRDELTLQETERAIRQLAGAGQDVTSRLLALLDDPQPEQHTVASVLLAATGNANLIPTLMEYIRDPAMDDVLKVKLIAVIAQLDPRTNPDDLFIHMSDLRAALQLVRREHLELLHSPHDLALWLESMQVEMPGPSRLSLIENSVELGDPVAVPMLICLCYDPVDEVALAAMDAVERFKDIRALRSLKELAQHHPRSAIRLEAQKTVDRLCIRASLIEARPAEPVAPIHACYLTSIDGTGEQVAFIVRRHPGDSFTVISIMFDDQAGIKECFGITVDIDELDEMLLGYTTEGIVPIYISHDQCLVALDSAVEANWRCEQPPPVSFLVWRELIEHGRSEQDTTSLVLDISPELREELLAHCHELLFQDEFMFWLFRPDEIEDLRVRYLKARKSGDTLDRNALQKLLFQGVQDIVTDGRRATIRGRLRRMAPLLRELYQEQEVWQWAVVAADALADDSGLPIQEHPFLIGMLVYSLEDALGATLGWFDGS